MRKKISTLILIVLFFGMAFPSLAQEELTQEQQEQEKTQKELERERRQQERKEQEELEKRTAKDYFLNLSLYYPVSINKTRYDKVNLNLTFIYSRVG